MTDKGKICKEENPLAVFSLKGGILYLLSFLLLENRDAEYFMVNIPMDDRIPFCEYFIVPYALWFLYMAFSFWYFLFRCKDTNEQRAAIYSMFAGMLVFVVVSLIFPNGHSLRPADTGDGLFGKCVALLYMADTSTNVLPSLHVFETVAAAIGLLRQEELKKHKGFKTAVVIISVLIVLSTMFLKQHSMVDVATALMLNIVCYIIFYQQNRIKEKRCTAKKYLQFQTY